MLMFLSVFLNARHQSAFPVLALNCIDVYVADITASNEDILIITKCHLGPNMIMCTFLETAGLIFF